MPRACEREVERQAVLLHSHNSAQSLGLSMLCDVHQCDLAGITCVQHAVTLYAFLAAKDTYISVLAA